MPKKDTVAYFPTFNTLGRGRYPYSSFNNLIASRE